MFSHLISRPKGVSNPELSTLRHNIKYIQKVNSAFFIWILSCRDELSKIRRREAMRFTFSLLRSWFRLNTYLNKIWVNVCCLENRDTILYDKRAKFNI